MSKLSALLLVFTTSLASLTGLAASLAHAADPNDPYVDNRTGSWMDNRTHL